MKKSVIITSAFVVVAIIVAIVIGRISSKKDLVNLYAEARNGSFDNSLKDELEKLTTAETNLEVKILDTAVTLSNLRDNIKNLRFSVEEADITLQQSKYEPPTTIRQAEISLDKANRSLEQSIRGYSLKVEQAR